MDASYLQRLERASSLLAAARTVVAFTGAGISTASGLADFRSLGGLWDRHPVVTYGEFLASETARMSYWAMRRELIPSLLAARPNPAHQALAALESSGRLQAVITQNIDGLHQRAGSGKVIELHGTNMQASCLDCGRSWPIADIQSRLDDGDKVPRCSACEGLIKPDTVSFGQSLPEQELSEAFRWARRCDLLLMIGSSLTVQPAALIVPAAAEGGAVLVFINHQETPYDSLAEVRFAEKADRVLPELVHGVISRT